MMPRGSMEQMQKEMMEQMERKQQMVDVVKSAQKGGLWIGFCLGFGIGVLAIEIVIHIAPLLGL